MAAVCGPRPLPAQALVMLQRPANGIASRHIDSCVDMSCSVYSLLLDHCGTASRVLVSLSFTARGRLMAL